MSTTSIRVVDHPSLGYTRKAIALIRKGVRIGYLHNDGAWYDVHGFSGRCPKMFVGTQSAIAHICSHPYILSMGGHSV